MLAPSGTYVAQANLRPRTQWDRLCFSDPQPITSYVEDVRMFYRYCEYFYTNTIVGTIITKMAYFSVDGLTIKSESEKTEREAANVIRKIRLKENLVKAIRDYQLYGIFFLYLMNKIRKTLKCNSCGTTYKLDDLHLHNVAQYRRDGDGQYMFKCQCETCKKHNQEQPFTLIEQSLMEPENIMINIWSPNRIYVSHNTITGDKMYSYDIEPEMRRKIEQNDHFTMCTTPELFINAAKKEMRVRVTTDKLFVYEAPTLLIHGLPIPPMARAFYDLGLSLKYKNANRTIAEDALIPLRMLFPVERGSIMGGPMAQTVNMDMVSDHVRREIAKFRKDKNYVPVIPFQVDMLTLWGDGKMLMTGEEIRSNNQDISANMGAPIEFIYGGATWSRQNVSAMVLQNQIKMFTDATQDTVSHVEGAINNGKPETERVELRLTTPELVEAYSKVGLLAQEHDKGRLSSETYFKHLGEDYNKEMRYKKKELESNGEVMKLIAQEQGQMAYEQTKAQLPLQADQREIARKENLKDSISQSAVERDAAERQINIQTRQQMIQMMLQQMAQERSMAMQEAAANKDAEKQLAMMKKQLKLQEKSQISTGKKQMKLQTEGMKQQAIAELETQDLVEQYNSNKQMQQALASMPPEQQQQIQQLPPEEQQAQIQQFMQQQTYDQAIQSLSPDQQSEYKMIPESEKQSYLDKVMQEQQEKEMLSQDPNYIKQRAIEVASNDEKKIQDKANVYNRLTPEQRAGFETEMMQENTDIYASVKEKADKDATYLYVAKLINSDPNQSQAIWEEIATTRPEIVDNVYNMVEQQLRYMNQASMYAIKLNALKGNPTEWKAMFDDINANSPESFRGMIYNEYAKVITGNKKSMQKQFNMDTYATAIAGSLQAMDEKEKNIFLAGLKAEAPDLWKKIMSIYLNLDAYNQEGVI